MSRKLIIPQTLFGKSEPMLSSHPNSSKLFASKNPLGHTFWNKISKISPTGQIKLPFENNPGDLVKENSKIYLSGKPKLKYKNYELLNGKILKLVEKVNDGSI